MTPHPRASEGYAYAEPSDVIGATVQNADIDAIYLRTATGRLILVDLGAAAMGGNPFIEYGLPKAGSE